MENSDKGVRLVWSGWVWFVGVRVQILTMFTKGGLSKTILHYPHKFRCDFTKYSLRFINRLGELKLKDNGPDEKQEDDDSDVLMSDNS
uniref:Uncharacterized protein n=1 Tax=Timema genevievae TaxID=629358 RepID=A0A7R9PQR1_TIMGE|nr:unnamed protein product [Timema genevievae]